MTSISTAAAKPSCGLLANAGPIGFGAWPIGNGTNTYGRVDEEEALAALRLFMETGGTFIDTARAYGERSERLVGQAVRESGRRDSVIIATKSAAGETRDSIPLLRKDLETSLKTMHIDVVDLFQLHQPPEDPDVMAEVLEELDRFKREGKIKASGASIKGPDVTDATGELCLRYIRSGKIDAIQVVYSVLRQKLAPIIREAGERGILVIARTVLESGFLAGLSSLGLGDPGSMCSFAPPDQRSRYSASSLQAVVAGAREFEESCRRLAGEVPFAHVATRFALSCQGVGTVILGMRNRAHVMENMNVTKSGVMKDARDLATLHAELVHRFAGRSAEFNYH